MAAITLNNSRNENYSASLSTDTYCHDLIWLPDTCCMQFAALFKIRSYFLVCTMYSRGRQKDKNSMKIYIYSANKTFALVDIYFLIDITG